MPLEDEANSKLLERAFRRRGIGFKLGARFERVEHTDTGVRVDARGRRDPRRRAAARRGRPRPDVGQPRLRGAAASPSTAASSSSTSTAGRRRRRVRGRRPHPHACSSRTSASPRASSSPSTSPACPWSPIDYAGVPRITYCQPEVASVGLTEAQAVEKFGADNIKTVTYDLSGNGRSAILNTKGAVKLVAEKDGPVLGIHIVGDRVGELIAEAQLIYNWEALPSEVAQLIHPHPTQSEAIGEAHLLLAGKPLHVHD